MALRNPVKTVTLSFFLGLTTASGPTWALEMRDAEKAVRMQDFSEAARIYHALAEQGDSKAQYQLANIYLQGKGVQKDEKLAQKWLAKSAEQNLAEAQFGLAQLIMKTEPERAQQLVNASAAQGYRPAKSLLERATPSSKTPSTVPFAKQWFGATRNNSVTELQALLQQENALELVDTSGRTALFYAVEASAHQALSWLIKNGANLNHKDNFGLTPLQTAIERKNTDALHTLLKAKADASVTLQNGDSLLHYAIRLDQFDLVPSLVSAGAPINAVNKDGWTALDLAEYKKAPTTISQLKTKGGKNGDGWRSQRQAQDVSKVASQLNNDKLPPAALAVINNNRKLLEQVIKENKEVLSTRLNDDATLIILAIKHHKPKMLATLIQLGGNVLQTGYHGLSPLHVATREGNIDAVKTLLSAGANPLQLDEAKRDVIMTAIETKQLEIAELLFTNLVGSGRSISEVRVHLKSIKASVNQYILLATQHQLDPLIDTLLPYATDDVAVDEQQRSALWFAASASNAKLILKLVKAGVPPDKEDTLGRTPFTIAVDNSCLECARQLLDYVDINHQTHSGNTALMLASTKGDALIAAWLLQNKANVELRNQRGNTAIMEAVNANSIEIVKHLLKANASVTRKNKLGFSAIDLAKQTSPQMLELVKSKSVLGLF